MEKGESEMIIFSEGTLAENQLDKGQPLELGYDKWTNNFYGNKAFLKNSIHYLMNDHKLLYIGNKENSLPIFDLESVAQRSNSWRIILFSLPLILLSGIGAIIFRFRKVKYSQ